jgi:flagellar basal-body rod protein FlgC
MRAMEISRSGLDVEWQRLQVIAQNLANMNTSRTGSGEPFQPMRLVSGPQGTRVLGVEAMPGNGRRVHEPNHPHADAEGFVTYPDIDHAGEMMLLMRASRTYEANLTALNMAQQMYSKALELGRQS